MSDICKLFNNAQFIRLPSGFILEREDESGKNSFLINLSDVKYMESIQLVQIRCIIDTIINSKVNYCITLPKLQKASDYSGRMELFKGTTYVYPHNLHAPKTFLPLYKINSDRNSDLYELCDNVFSGFDVATNYTYNIVDSFTELADNIFFHSGKMINTGWGYVHAQAYPRNRVIKIAIADSGIGFYESYVRTGQTRGRDEKK